ncbi:MAG: LPS assembly lipoprotein LptE [Thiovulaceae bacterium]|nr:LPS assembly lipoprotein LptE [Sulfurimonadaceae bacterium]MDD3816966.1 LPS assembly lipoprotein LptE [Sulfurimonadaceae bacterium]
MVCFAHAKRFFALFAALFLLAGCGYKPSSKFSREVIGEKISTSVTISSLDPENTVIIKDAIDEAIIQTFRASLVSKEESDSHLVLSISNPTYSPIQYNEDGYVIGYRMSLSLHITKIGNGISKNYATRGTYDFSVLPNAIVTDKERFDAIRQSAAKAIAAFVAQVSAEGTRKKQ